MCDPKERPFMIAADILWSPQGRLFRCDIARLLLALMIVCGYGLPSWADNRSRAEVIDAFDVNGDWNASAIPSTAILRGSFPIEGDIGHHLAWVGPKAVVTLRTTAAQQALSLVITGFVPAAAIARATGATAKDRLGVFVNGTQVVSQDFEVDGNFTLYAPAAAVFAALHGSDLAEIEIRASHSYNPAKLGYGSDDRVVSFMIRTIKFQDLTRERDAGNFDANDHWDSSTVPSTSVLRGSFGIEGVPGHRLAWVGPRSLVTLPVADPSLPLSLVITGWVPAAAIAKASETPGKDRIRVLVNSQDVAAQDFDIDDDITIYAPAPVVRAALHGGSLAEVEILASRSHDFESGYFYSGQPLAFKVGSISFKDVTRERDASRFDANDDWSASTLPSTSVLRGSFDIEGEPNHHFASRADREEAESPRSVNPL
jgi:hypothetical protein